MTETITTAAELRDYPLGSTFTDAQGDVWMVDSRYTSTSYGTTPGVMLISPETARMDGVRVLRKYGPLTPQWRPDQPTPTVKPGEKDIIEAMVSAAPEVYAERGVMWHESKAEDIRASAGPYARAVLALLPGRTVDEVWRAAWEVGRAGIDRDESLARYMAGGE